MLHEQGAGHTGATGKDKGLEALGLAVTCVEAFQAHQFLKAQRNKTDDKSSGKLLGKSEK